MGLSPGAFSGLHKPARVFSCYGQGNRALEHGRAWAPQTGPTERDGTARVWDPYRWRLSDHVVCVAWVPPTLLDGGSDRCRDEPPRALPAPFYCYPLPLRVLRFARLVEAAVQSLDTRITARVVQCWEPRIGQRALVEVAHAAGGRGEIEIVAAWGELWVDRSTCPPMITDAARRGLAEAE